MQKYSYTGFHRLRVITSQLTGVLAILIFNGFSGFLLYAMNKVPIDKPDKGLLENPGSTLICLIVYFAVISWLFGLTFINFLPTIWVVDEGLVISSFFILRILIHWEDIVDIDERRVSRGFILVRTRQITPLHRIYGWLYTRTFFPSFVIGNDISRRDELLTIIEQKKREVVKMK